MVDIRGPAALVTYRALSDVAGKGSFFLITVAAARRLSPEAFGIFAIASTLGWMIAVVTDGGIQLHVAREVARQPAAAAALLRRWLRVRLGTAAVAFAIAAIGVALARSWRAYAVPMMLLVLVYLCSALVEFLYYFYRGLGRTDLESTMTLWQRLGALACVLSVLAWRPSLTALAAALLIPSGLALAYSARVAARLTSLQRADREISSPRDRATNAYWKSVFPIGAGIALSALYFRIDVFLVDRWNGAEAVGRYNAVFRLIEALRLFPAAVIAVLLPSLVQAVNARAVLRLSSFLVVIASFATLVLWTTASWIIPAVYGAPFAAAVTAFRVLALCFPLFSLNYALTHQLIGWDGQRAYALVCAVALAANLALNVRLIPAWSIEGAAWATLWTEAIVTAGCGLALWLRGAPATSAVSSVAILS